MNPFNFTPLYLMLVISCELIAQQPTSLKESEEKLVTGDKHKINFFIISRPRKLDPGAYFQIMRTGVRNLTRRKKFRAIVANSSKAMAAKVIRRLKKHNASINHLWFDSHGYYAKGYSSFSMGKDEFNYANITDSSH